jgi:copper(I)-binding protein
MIRGLVLFLLLLMLAVVGCAALGSDSGNLEIENVWGRSSPTVAQNGAFYLTITNGSGEAEQLLSAETDACGTVELHEMFMKENDVMGMRPVPGGTISIAKGETVELKVGGMHVMCIDKKGAFEVGDSIPIVLDFSGAGEIEVTAEIRESEMEGMDMGEGDSN